MKKSLILFCMLGSMLPSLAFSSFYDGNYLKTKMESAVTSDQMVAMGFVVGVADTLGDRDFRYVCIAKGVTAGQLSEVVLKYLRANPEALHKAAYTLVYLALIKTWSCPKSNARNGSDSNAPTEKAQVKPKSKPIAKPVEPSPF
jgi:hypothetical protein